MFASTKQARSLLRFAFVSAGASLPSHTYTEKTTEYDSNRRSIVFPVDVKFADEVKHKAREFFQEVGFTKSVPKLTTNVSYQGPGRLIQTTYIRVIAYK